MRPYTSTDGAVVASPARVLSVDAFRGFVMLLMMAEVLHLSALARSFPTSDFWRVLAYHQTHVEWVGCTLHDLIQPSFSFLVGVALPFSIAARMARGQSRAVMTMHALWRALLLVLLGVFLRSIGRPLTNWTFEDTLTQIGLGYPFLFLLGFTKPRVQWASFALIVIGYWAAWALYPLPGPDFDYAAAGAQANWEHNTTGFAAHWNKNLNLGSAFDQWFLNLFPRTRPFVANSGGYLTLSFIPTLATMILGLVAGRWLRSEISVSQRLRRCVLAGVLGLAAGAALHLLGIGPLVKRIWTPSWVLYSGGWAFLLLAGFYALIDVRGWKRWAFPLIVIGMNSIAAYCIAHLFEGFIVDNFKTHFGQDIFKMFGDAFVPLLRGLVLLLGFWLILWWINRRRIFLRI